MRDVVGEVARAHARLEIALNDRERLGALIERSPSLDAVTKDRLISVLSRDVRRAADQFIEFCEDLEK